MIVSARGIGLAGAVVAALALSACGDKPQTKTERKVDTTAHSGSTVAGYTAGGWKAGDKVSWESQLRERNKGQNEYERR